MEENKSQHYFKHSPNVWFPDLEEKMEGAQRRWQRTSFDGMLELLRYFRSEITRQQFLHQFLRQGLPEKLLPSDREKYLQIKTLCTDHLEQKISDAELDEGLLLCFRARPAGDVFAPAFEDWEEIKALISGLEKKSAALPCYFDGLGWCGYLRGLVTSHQYAEGILAWDTGGYLAQLCDYGVDSVKTSLRERYQREVSVSLHLRDLCIDYKKELMTTEAFNAQFLQLAREFCADTGE